MTRPDWLLAVLVSDGVEQVKISSLADQLAVSRSSFYRYFKSRQDLLDALLEEWQALNTAAFIAQCEAPARTVTDAVLNVWRCVVNPGLFDAALDFAIRDWARRSGKVRVLLYRSDAARLMALTRMFAPLAMVRTKPEPGRVRSITFRSVMTWRICMRGWSSASLGSRTFC